jgi:hypothetical protein
MKKPTTAEDAGRAMADKPVLEQLNQAIALAMKMSITLAAIEAAVHEVGPTDAEKIADVGRLLSESGDALHAMTGLDAITVERPD